MSILKRLYSVIRDYISVYTYRRQSTWYRAVCKSIQHHTKDQAHRSVYDIATDIHIPHASYASTLSGPIRTIAIDIPKDLVPSNLHEKISKDDYINLYPVSSDARIRTICKSYDKFPMAVGMLYLNNDIDLINPRSKRLKIDSLIVLTNSILDSYHPLNHKQDCDDPINASEVLMYNAILLHEAGHLAHKHYHQSYKRLYNKIRRKGATTIKDITADSTLVNGVCITSTPKEDKECEADYYAATHGAAYGLFITLFTLAIKIPYVYRDKEAAVTIMRHLLYRAFTIFAQALNVPTTMIFDMAFDMATSLSKNPIEASYPYIAAAVSHNFATHPDERIQLATKYLMFSDMVYSLQSEWIDKQLNNDQNYHNYYLRYREIHKYTKDIYKKLQEALKDDPFPVDIKYDPYADFHQKQDYLQDGTLYVPS